MALDQDTAQRIVDAIANGEHLKTIAAQHGVNPSTIWRWQQANAEFATQCARARESAAAVNEADIASLMSEVKRGDVTPDAARVLLNGLTWLAKVKAPRVYGDRTTLAGDPNAPLVVDDASEVRRKLLHGLAAAGTAAPPGEPE